MEHAYDRASAGAAVAGVRVRIFGTDETVTARFWPQLQPFSVRSTLESFEVFPPRSDACLKEKSFNLKLSGHDAYYTA